MKRYAAIVFLSLTNYQTFSQVDYLNYQRQIIQCEELIANSKFETALEKYEALFVQYQFIFLKDIQVATQLSAHTKNIASGIKLVKLGIQHGWTIKAIRKEKGLKVILDSPEWENIQSYYDSLYQEYLNRIDIPLQGNVKQMFLQDQKMALKALYKIGQNAKTRYAENKFAPHSEQQLTKLEMILNETGYPGEMLIGNNWWVSVMLSHHNSISKSFNERDKLYDGLRPKLLEAIKNGQLSPEEFAVIEDWKIAVLHHHELTKYGFLGKIPNGEVKTEVNENRAEIGLRSIDLRNRLIEIEEETGLNLHLPKGWQQGKIGIIDE